MKKELLDFKVVSCNKLNANYALLILTPVSGSLPEIVPGQFVEARIDGSPTTFLRRPISVHFVDYPDNRLWLLVQAVGDGTRIMTQLKEGEILNLILPLGRGFSIPADTATKVLLIGGGVGVAPLLYLGEILRQMGIAPHFLLGARSESDILQLDKFESIGTVSITTEDGSLGEKGYVTQHSLLANTPFDILYTCGPKPMMKAVAHYAMSHKIACEVSLENTMACGFGVCLCCVENTKQGNVCVCKEGPVFNIEQLQWHN